MAHERLTDLVNQVALYLGHASALRGQDLPATLAEWLEASHEAYEVEAKSDVHTQMHIPGPISWWSTSPLQDGETFAVEYATASHRLHVRAAEKADGSGGVTLTVWAGPRWSRGPYVSEGETHRDRPGLLRENGLYQFKGDYYVAENWGEESAGLFLPEAERPSGYAHHPTLRVEFGEVWRGRPLDSDEIGELEELVDTGVTIPPKYHAPVAHPEPCARVVINIRPGGGVVGYPLLEVLSEDLVVEKPERVSLLGDICRRIEIRLSGQAEEAFRAAEAAVWGRKALDEAVRQAVQPPR